MGQVKKKWGEAVKASYHIEKGILENRIYCGKIVEDHWVEKIDATELACVAVARYIAEEFESKTMERSIDGRPQYQIEVTKIGLEELV